MRWITVGPTDQPGTSIVLHPPAADPGITDDERRTIAEMMAKGSYATIVLATSDLDGTFERLQASDAEVIQEPTDQPYGIRDCAFRDPRATTSASIRSARPSARAARAFTELGRLDSNQNLPDSKSGGLPITPRPIHLPQRFPRRLSA